MVKEILKYSVWGIFWYFFFVFSEMREERGKLREELLDKEELGLDDFENFFFFYVVKDIKSYKWLLEVCFRERVAYVIG